MPDQLSQYYDYLKSNGADVAPSLESFKSTLSDEKTAKQYYTYLRDNKFDTPDTFDSFVNTFDLKKKESTPSPSLGGSLLSKVPKENTNILSDVSLQGVTNALPNSGKQVNEVADLHRGIKPTIDKVALKESAEKIPNFKEAVDNAVIEKNKKFGVTSKFDMNFGRADIEKQIKDGDLVPIKNSKGESKLVQGTGVLESFANAVNDKFEKDATDSYWANASKEDRIKHLNYKLNNPQEVEHEASGVPAKVSQFIGENINMLGKGAVAGMGATALALPSGGASFAQFLSMLPEMAQGGYVNGLEKNYIGLKKQHPEMSDEEAYDKANKAGLLSEATGIATDAALSGSISQNLLGKVPKPNIDVKGVFDGIVNSAKHAVTSFPKVGGVSVVGSLVNDLASNAIGNKVKGDEVGKNALESAKQMAVMHFGLWALSEPMKIPSYIRPQVENLVASAPREEVQQFYEDAEKKGAVPEGTTQKVLTKLSEFDEQKAVVDKMPLSEEQKAAMTGKLLQRKKIAEENSELKKYGASFNDKIEANDAKIEQLDKETNGIAKSKDVFKHETDTRLGTPAKVENEPTETIPNEQGQEQAPEILNPTEVEKPITEKVSETIQPTEEPKVEEKSTPTIKEEVKGFTAKEGNKVVDEKGEPLVVYHGTDKDFNDFEKTKSQRQNLLSLHDVASDAHFFTTDKEFAKNFGKNVKELHISIKKPANENHQDVIDAIKETYPNGKFETSNGLVYMEDYPNDSWIKKIADKDGIDWVLLDDNKFIDNLKKRGIDGTGVWEDNGSTSYAVFDKSQIKPKTESTPKEEVKGETKTETPKVEEKTRSRTSGEEAEKQKTVEEQYRDIELLESKKEQENAKEKLINDNFESIVSQLMLKNKIKRIC